MRELKNIKYSVEITQPEAGVMDSTMLKVNPTRITANGNILAVYEYANPTESETWAKTISPDGNRVGMNFVSWISEPYFYKSGRIIVQYVGDNAQLISDLNKIMGSPFASMN